MHLCPRKDDSLSGYNFIKTIGKKQMNKIRKNRSKISKQIRPYPLLFLLTLLLSCNPQNTTIPDQIPIPKQTPNNTPALQNLKNIRSMLHDKNGNYWFGTNESGVFRYDGKSLVQFSVKDGLCDNQIRTIQEDSTGNIWFGTGIGVSRFDGKTFTTFPNKDSQHWDKNAHKNWKSTPEDLWFEAGGGAYRYDGQSFTYLALPAMDSKHPNPSNPANPFSDPANVYTVYCTMKDKKGNIWFGTQTLGVCCYNPSVVGGKAFTWFTEKGVSGPAVRGLFEDKNGVYWFGNNGYGLMRYDGQSLTNITEEKGLGNEEFFKTSKVTDKLGTLARVWTINEDKNGDLWIGTIDAGVWRYDGINLTNYTTKDGLPSNVVNMVYKDKKGELWFGTAEGGVCKFDGKYFTRFAFN